MDTDKLIGSLSRDLKPVKPLAPPLRRTAVFTACAMLAALVLVLAAGAREDAAHVLHSPRFIAENTLMFLSGALAAFAAFHLSVPDTKIRKPVLVALLLATTAWLVLSLSCCGDLQNHGSHLHPGFHCLRDLAAIAVLPLVAAFILLNRAAPVWSGWAGYGMVLSVASFAAIGMRFLCEEDSSTHLLLWHYAPVLFLAVIGIFLGKTLVKWKYPPLKENKK